MENGEDFMQNDSEFAAMENKQWMKPDFEENFKQTFFNSALINGELKKLNSEDDFKRLWARLRDSLEEKKRELERLHEAWNLEFERFPNPEKRLCIHYFDHDDSNFLAVDLETGKSSPILSSKEIHKHHKHPIFGSLDSRVYNAYHASKDGKAIVTGLCFDLRSPDLGSVDLEFSPLISSPVSYKSSIYAFNRTSSEAEFYNFTQNPPIFKRLRISNWPQRKPDFDVIPDPFSDRILFFFHDCGLYALYPEEEDGELSFTCLDPNISVDWYSTLRVIVDGVIYFLSEFARKPPVVAYDLEKNKVLDVEWESNCDSWGEDVVYNRSSRLFHLGNGILCLAYYVVRSSEVTALYFKVKKHSSRESIVATIGPSYQIKINAHHHPAGFFAMKADD